MPYGLGQSPHAHRLQDKRLDFMEFQRLMNSANVLLQHEVPGKTNFLHVNATTETWFKTFIAGGVAGVVSRTAVSPLERIKILFQVRALSWRPPRLTHYTDAGSHPWQAAQVYEHERRPCDHLSRGRLEGDLRFCAIEDTEIGRASSKATPRTAFASSPAPPFSSLPTSNTRRCARTLLVVISVDLPSALCSSPRSSGSP